MGDNPVQCTDDGKGSEVFGAVDFPFGRVDDVGCLRQKGEPRVVEIVRWSPMRVIEHVMSDLENNLGGNLVHRFECFGWNTVWSWCRVGRGVNNFFDVINGGRPSINVGVLELILKNVYPIVEFSVIGFNDFSNLAQSLFIRFVTYLFGALDDLVVDRVEGVTEDINRCGLWSFDPVYGSLCGFGGFEAVACFVAVPMASVFDVIGDTSFVGVRDQFEYVSGLQCLV